uniref:Uncharacterized protein n=1 Tax=Nonomuraea gerenzanensis TaxID=93944 RepID=A0A1M4E1I2_9ACTN|nr:hypothetical protein BN4615_P2224 [Nonomuraea gerenzanensis]
MPPIPPKTPTATTPASSWGTVISARPANPISAATGAKPTRSTRPPTGPPPTGITLDTTATGSTLGTKPTGSTLGTKPTGGTPSPRPTGTTSRTSEAARPFVRGAVASPTLPSRTPPPARTIRCPGAPLTVLSATGRLRPIATAVTHGSLPIHPATRPTTSSSRREHPGSLTMTNLPPSRRPFDEHRQHCAPHPPPNS